MSSLIHKSLEDQVAELLLGLSKGRPLCNQPRRIQVTKEIGTDLRNSFIKCTVLPYGLDEIGIAEDSTCLYLSVDTFGKVDTSGKTLSGTLSLNTCSYTTISQQIFKILQSNSSAYEYISMKSLQVYANLSFGNLMPTPLPEISFVHSKTNAKCKIRLENYFSVQKTRLLQFYSRLDVRFWPMLMFVRHWATQFRALRSADSLDFQNYAVCLLLVNFVASKKIIPSLYELQAMKDTSVDRNFIVNDFDLSFCTNVSVVRPSATVPNPALQDKELRTLSIVSMLKCFFAFCSTFDFKSNVICPYLGETLSRDLFHTKGDWKTLPPTLAAYLTGPDGKTRPERLYLVGPICIQDIFELTKNVTRTVSEEESSRFAEQCAKTSKILENVLNQSGTACLADAFNEND